MDYYEVLVQDIEACIMNFNETKKKNLKKISFWTTSMHSFRVLILKCVCIVCVRERGGVVVCITPLNWS